MGLSDASDPQEGLMIAKREYLCALSVALLTGVAALLIAVAGGGLARSLATVTVFFAPGLAWTPCLRLKDPALIVTVGLLVCISSTICAAQVVTYVASFSWRPCEYVLLSITACGLFTQLVTIALARRRTAL